MGKPTKVFFLCAIETVIPFIIRNKSSSTALVFYEFPEFCFECTWNFCKYFMGENWYSRVVFVRWIFIHSETSLQAVKTSRRVSCLYNFAALFSMIKHRTKRCKLYQHNTRRDVFTARWLMSKYTVKKNPSFNYRFYRSMTNVEMYSK